MKSHEYYFSRREVAGVVGGPILVFLVLALVLRMSAGSGVLPQPRSTWNMDRTILVHQAESSETSERVDLLFLGDSSCLMDFSARELEMLLPERPAVLNLGLISYVGLESYGLVLETYLRRHPGILPRVVVLLHPEMLRGVEPVPQFHRLLESYYSGEENCEEVDMFSGLLCQTGLVAVRDRIYSRVLPVPLPGNYGRFYGFNIQLEAFMKAEKGSAVDPNVFQSGMAQGHAEYRLSKRIETGSRIFRSRLPRELRVWVGITPVPESMASKTFPEQYQQMLGVWGEWMQAEAVLAELPPVMADSLFASSTHLNQQGRRLFTRQLGAVLSGKLSATTVKSP